MASEEAKIPTGGRNDATPPCSFRSPSVEQLDSERRRTDGDAGCPKDVMSVGVLSPTASGEKE